jgi:hypothetical protein
VPRPNSTSFSVQSISRNAWVFRTLDLSFLFRQPLFHSISEQTTMVTNVLVLPS